jgi:hypothetical protein
VQHQRVNRELADLRRTERQQRNTTYGDRFVQAARILLSDSVFSAIHQEALGAAMAPTAEGQRS